MADALSPHRYRNMAVPTRPLSPAEHQELPRRLQNFYENTDSWVIASIVPFETTSPTLVLDCEEELMVYPSGRLERPKRDNFEVREVQTAEDMAIFEWVWATAYEKPHLLVDGARRYDERILGNGQRLWLGYDREEPVATAASFVSNGLNLVRGVTTLHSHRGRGIGSYMTQVAMTADSSTRYLNSEIGAESVYRRLGFETVGTFQFWKWAS
jgi:hypothetical protein